MRVDGRAPDQMRPIRITPGFIPQAEGSVLIEVGRTRVICTASVEETVPAFLKGSGKGWITSEYSMIPRATNTRTARESSIGKKSGRTQEIQRLIGRSMRAAVELEKLGERQIWIDCDVIEADGGTRTASITGAFMALSLAIRNLMASNRLTQNPVRSHVAAVSVGIVGGVPMLDLNYVEDSGADVDFNLVMTDRDEFVEIQGTAERFPFSGRALNQLLELGQSGIRQLIETQQKILQQ
jgi:ribonuclease PH